MNKKEIERLAKVEQKLDDLMERLHAIEKKLDVTIKEHDGLKQKIARHDQSLAIIGTLAGSAFTAVFIFLVPKLFGG